MSSGMSREATRWHRDTEDVTSENYPAAGWRREGEFKEVNLVRTETALLLCVVSYLSDRSNYSDNI